MADAAGGGQLPARTKLLYGVGDVGNAIVNPAIQFFLMIFYTDAALIKKAEALAGAAGFTPDIGDTIPAPFGEAEWKAIVDYVQNENSELEQIILCLWDQNAFQSFENALSKINL